MLGLKNEPRTFLDYNAEYTGAEYQYTTHNTRGIQQLKEMNKIKFKATRLYMPKFVHKYNFHVK